MKNKALIVVDMQNDFISGVLGSPEARAIVSRVAEAIKEFDGEIYATMDTHTEEYLQTAEGRRIPAHCVKDTEGWELPREIAEALALRGARIVEKGTFGSLELADKLKEHPDGYKGIVLCGLCTDICVVGNALVLRAAFPKAEIAVLADCCAGTTQGMHESALDVMRSCCISVK